MSNAMNEFKQTASTHMRRDFDAGGKWLCSCEACHEIRSLVGIKERLGIRPLITEIEKTEDRLKGLPDGPKKFTLQNRYLRLLDQLADELAKKAGPRMTT
jgi:hypothetical protein